MGAIRLPYWTDASCYAGVADRCLVQNEVLEAAKISRFNFDAMPQCVFIKYGICFQKATEPLASPIFNFSVFVTALTLMAVVFTITDARFKFRVAVAPGPVIGFSSILIFFIGFCLLWSDIAFSLKWMVPATFNSAVLWQVASGAAFFILFFIWITIGFLKPPKFGRLNAFKYARELYRIILTGNNSEITVVAQELTRSASSLIQLAPLPVSQSRRTTQLRSQPMRRQIDRLNSAAWSSLRRVLGDSFTKWLSARVPSAAGEHALSILSLMGGRRFCSCVAAGAPATAIAFFQEMGRRKKYALPVRQFSTNISGEAILNNQSLLYHEDDGWRSGALGYWKPLSTALYGNYELVEGLAHGNGSPLDISYFSHSKWSAEQFEAYTRAVLITFEAYLKGGYWGTHSYSLLRAFHAISDIAGEHNFTLEDDAENEGYRSESVKKLNIGVSFVKDALEQIGKMKEVPRPTLRAISEQKVQYHDMYDNLAMLAYSLIKGASHVRSERNHWGIQYNSVWSPLFARSRGHRAWDVVRHKVAHLLLDEIQGDWFSYLSSRVFGMTLNVVGFRDITIGRDSIERALRRSVVRWARKNLMRVWDDNPEVVRSGLPHSLSIEPKLRRIVKTYSNGFERKPRILYFQLD